MSRANARKCESMSQDTRTGWPGNVRDKELTAAAPLTEAAIHQVRQMVADGELVPGQRLPPESELAESLGTSRNTVREAVRALVTARVLDVRRGDGTYVTSLRPELLLAGIGAAADLLQNEFTHELVQVRRQNVKLTALEDCRAGGAVVTETRCWLCEAGRVASLP